MSPSSLGDRPKLEGALKPVLAFRPSLKDTDLLWDSAELNRWIFHPGRRLQVLVRGTFGEFFGSDLTWFTSRTDISTQLFLLVELSPIMSRIYPRCLDPPTR